MVGKIKIVSDGWGNGTRVLNEDGKEIPGISRIEISPIESEGHVSAIVTFDIVELDVEIASEVPKPVPAPMKRGAAPGAIS